MILYQRWGGRMNGQVRLMCSYLENLMDDRGGAVGKDITNKLATARNIVLACKNGNLPANPNNQEELLMAIKKSTSIYLPTIKLYSLATKHRKKFENYLNKPSHVCKIRYECFRNVIYKLYAKDQVVPTKENILRRLDLSPEYTSTNVVDDLKGNGFLFKKLPLKKKALIVEDPERIYRRMIYLNRIAVFRLLKKNFVYVICKDEKPLIAISPLSGLLSFEPHTPCSNSESRRFRNFIESVVPFLPESSVVVLESNEIRANSLPTQYSSREQMRQWLNKHDIPYEAGAHTAELYALVRKFGTKFRNTCEIQDLLERRGFDVLRLPSELPTLSYYNSMSSLINNLPEAQHMTTVYKNCSKKELCCLEETLKKEEMRVYSEELELEKIIDMINIVSTNAAYGQDFKQVDVYNKEVSPSYIIL